ncbi:unnamed protein product [Chrysoparadoxa australica]
MLKYKSGQKARKGGGVGFAALAKLDEKHAVQGAPDSTPRTQFGSPVSNAAGSPDTSEAGGLVPMASADYGCYVSTDYATDTRTQGVQHSTMINRDKSMGVFFLDMGEKYEGEHDDQGRFNGQGRYTYANGSVYNGQWQNHKRNGWGTFTSVSGERYKGPWVDDKRHGQKATQTFDSGDTVEGSFANDKIQGKAVYRYGLTGDVFSGEYQEGLMHGCGEYQWANGDKETGWWKQDKEDGEHTFCAANGQKFLLVFKEGQLISREEFKGGCTCIIS